MRDLAPPKPKPAPSDAVPSGAPTVVANGHGAPTPVAATTDTAAAATTAPTTADDRATTFQAVSGGPETKSGEVLLVEAYTVLWVILMAWLVYVWRAQSRLHGRLDGLEAALKRAGAVPEARDADAATAGRHDDKGASPVPRDADATS